MNINAILKAEIIEQPWHHAVVENLFDEEEFLKLSHFAKFYTEKEKDALNKKWKEDEKGYKPRGKKPALSFFIPEWNKMGFDSSLGEGWLKIFNKNIKNILSHYGQHRFADKYHTELFFNFTPIDQIFNIHHDTSKKVWTLAYYLHPEKNTGTQLYDLKKRHVSDAPWKLNSGCAFCPQDGVTWHNYRNKSLTDFRSVLIINICR